ncbi:MAG: Crp/Fnr family transcriptional regulator [Bacillota bacterium]|nr:Crp/Fnr family transcriptional regulator [Bacillota bacterium]
MTFTWKQPLPPSPLFAGMTQHEIREVLDCVSPSVVSFERGEIIALGGEPIAGVGLVLAGEVLITKEDAAGNRAVMAAAAPGEVFGEMAAFSGQRVWPATVTAQTASIVMLIPPEKFTGTCARACPGHRLLAANMLRIVSQKALMLGRKLEYLSMKTLRGKIAAFVLEQAARAGALTFLMPMNRDEMAGFLNVSRPALSREMARMRDEGLIDFHRSSVKIKDPSALRRSTE